MWEPQETTCIAVEHRSSRPVPPVRRDGLSASTTGVGTVAELRHSGHGDIGTGAVRQRRECGTGSPDEPDGLPASRLESWHSPPTHFPENLLRVRMKRSSAERRAVLPLLESRAQELRRSIRPRSNAAEDGTYRLGSPDRGASAQSGGGSGSKRATTGFDRCRQRHSKGEESFA